MERILASSHFRSSRRYPALLQYVVEKTLAGDVDALKERMLGVEVFHRALDYDTNADPVVRFSAGEVRRRIAQYYKDNEPNAPIEINLPVGNYIPLFLRMGSGAEDQNGPQTLTHEPHELPHHHRAADGVGHGIPQPPVAGAASTSRRIFLLGALAGMAGAAATVGAGYLIRAARLAKSPQSRLDQVWEPLLNSPDGVLIEVSRTHFEAKETPQPPNATIEQHILRPEARISLAAVQALSQVVGFLQAQHKPFFIHEANSDTLQDLHRHPVVLVSGFNNHWVIRLLAQLRFSLLQVGTIHRIVDNEHPERTDWAVDFDTPYLQQTVDYAVVGRFLNATTNGPVVVIAGVGSNGSQAGGEFMVSPAALDALAQAAPHGSLEENFLAVLRVEVIAGNTGASTVVATTFW
jgi:hypothetical protein